MTVELEIPENRFQAIVTNEFQLDYYVHEIEELVITLNGVVVAPNLYTIQFGTLQNYNGAKVLFAVAITGVVVITRITPMFRATIYSNATNNITGSNLNYDFDRLYRIIQEKELAINKVDDKADFLQEQINTEILDRVAGDLAVREYANTLVLGSGNNAYYQLDSEGSVIRSQYDKNKENTTLADFGEDVAVALTSAANSGLNINVTTAIDATLTAVQVETLLANLDKFTFSLPSVIRLPAQTVSFSSTQIALYTQNHTNLKILGSTPVDVVINSLVSVVGAPGNWDLTYTLADASSVDVGNYLKVDSVLGGATWVARDVVRFVSQGELAVGTHKMGVGTVSGTTITFSYESEASLPSNWIQVGNLIHFKGQTREVSAVDDTARTITVSSSFSSTTEIDEFDSDLISYQWWYYTKAEAGVISITNSINITGTGTNFMSYVEVGDILLFNGVMSEITHVISDTHIRIEANYHTVVGAKFTILKPGLILNEGTHEVISKAGNNVTVKLKTWQGWSATTTAGIKPRTKGWLGGVTKVIKSVLKQDNVLGSGFVGRNGGTLYADNLVVRGGSGGTGIRLRGEVTEDVYSATQSQFTLGRNSAIVGFSNTVVGFAGSHVHAPYAHFLGSSGHGLAITEGCSAYLRGSVISGHTGVGLLLSGNYCRLSEVRLTGNKLQGIRTDAGGFFYSDSGYAFGNGSHGLMIVNSSGGQFADGYSMCNGGSGINTQNGGTGRFSRILAACNSNHGLSFTASMVEVGHCWVTGSKATRSGLVNNASQVSAFAGAASGNGGVGVLLLQGGLLSMQGGYLSKNKLGGISARELSRGALLNSYVAGNNTADVVVTTGALISGVTSESISVNQLSGAINTANVIIANDAVAVFNKNSVYGYVCGVIEVIGSSPAAVWGESYIRVGSSNSTSKMRGHDNFVTDNITLTGTNSLAGKLTISTDAEKIYIANRLGSTININVVIRGRVL